MTPPHKLTEREYDLRCTVIQLIIQKLNRLDLNGLSVVLIKAEELMEAQKKAQKERKNIF